MTQKSSRVGGSRYLYEPFEVHTVRLEAQERVYEERWAGLEKRLTRIEDVLDRLEKRLWMAVSGAAGLVAADIVYTLLSN